MDENIENYLRENKKCFDRFTFDLLLRMLLIEGFSHEEAKDIILFNCSLSTLVIQERIENNFYKNISLNEDSEDLIKLKTEIYFLKFVSKN